MILCKKYNVKESVLLYLLQVLQPFESQFNYLFNPLGRHFSKYKTPSRFRLAAENKQYVTDAFLEVAQICRFDRVWKDG